MNPAQPTPPSLTESDAPFPRKEPDFTAPAGPRGGTGMRVPRFALDAGSPPGLPTLASPPAPRRFWRKRRYWVLGAALGVIAATLATALVRRRQTFIIVINAGPETLPPLTISTGVHRHGMPALASGAAYHWLLPAGGDAAPILIKSSTLDSDSPRQWEAGPFTPVEGARRILQLFPDGSMQDTSSSANWLDLPGT